MKRRLLALALTLPATVTAQTPTPAPAATPAPAPVPRHQTVRVVVTTSEGAIVLALEKQRAPVTTANFLRYVDGKKLDGTAFYRAVKVGEGYGLIQFGTRNDPKRTLPPIRHEPTTATGVSHADGTISMAMAAPNTAAGDFFITVGELVSMNATPARPGPAKPGFAAFGHVVEGMDIVRRILVRPTSPTLGAGVMKGQMLSPVIKVVSVRRAAP